MKNIIYPIALAGMLALSACGSSTDAEVEAVEAVEAVDPFRAAECLQSFSEGEPQESCRLEGYDPLWNAIGIYVTDADYAAYQRNGTVPRCENISGRTNPFGGEYGRKEVASCNKMAGNEVAESESEFNTAISDAAAECFVNGNVADEGQSISFDTEGNDDYTGDAIDDVACVLRELDVPTYVIQRMDGTRALDGTLDAEWDQYTAFWNYHPDSGMNLTIYTV